MTILGSNRPMVLGLATCINPGIRAHQTPLRLTSKLEELISFVCITYRQFLRCMRQGTVGNVRRLDVSLMVLSTSDRQQDLPRHLG